MHDLSFELTNLATKRCQAESAFHCESFANSPFRVLPVLVFLLLPLLLLCNVALPGRPRPGISLLPNPTTNGGMQKKKMEAQSEHVHVAYTSLHVFGADLDAQSAISNKISESELRRKFIRSVLLVG